MDYRQIKRQVKAHDIWITVRLDGKLKKLLDSYNNIP